MEKKTAKPVNYTVEQTSAMVADYVASPTLETVEKIALALGKTVRSVVAKLSREKVYIAKVYVNKNGEKIAKKNDTADAIGKVLLMTEPEIESLTKCNKTALAKIWKLVTESRPA